MRILFFGTPDFAAGVLAGIIKSEHSVVGVITRADAAVGRKRVLTPPAVKAFITTNGIKAPVLQPTSLKTDEFVEVIRALGADIGVVAAYGRILRRDVLEAFPYGCINVHGSILPAYRGASPVQSAIINGEKETGITIIQMDEGIDTGDILHIRKADIQKNETSGELLGRLAPIGARAAIEAMDMIASGRAKAVKQDSGAATYTKQLTKEDGYIDWKQDAHKIVNRINGLNPWPGAFADIADGEVKLWRAAYSPMGDKSYTPGEIAFADKKNGLVIGAIGGGVSVVELQAPGGKRVGAADFINGMKNHYRLKPVD